MTYLWQVPAVGDGTAQSTLQYMEKQSAVYGGDNSPLDSFASWFLDVSGVWDIIVKNYSYRDTCRDYDSFEVLPRNVAADIYEYAVSSNVLHSSENFDGRPGFFWLFAGKDR